MFMKTMEITKLPNKCLGYKKIMCYFLFWSFNLLKMQFPVKLLTSANSEMPYICPSKYVHIRGRKFTNFQNGIPLSTLNAGWGGGEPH